MTQKTKPDTKDISVLYFCNAWNQLQFLNHISLSLALPKDKLTLNKFKAVSLNQQILAIIIVSKNCFLQGLLKEYERSQINLCIYHFQFFKKTSILQINQNINQSLSTNQIDSKSKFLNRDGRNILYSQIHTDEIWH